METQVRTPQMVFMQPQRLVVPLFQRPYVWNEENQWEPLWNDVVRVADRVLNQPLEKHHPHFLGAVVLQQVQKQTGQGSRSTVLKPFKYGQRPSKPSFENSCRWSS
jgi:uncharacterized protein DUF262